MTWLDQRDEFGRMKDPMRGRPLKRGDAQNVVVELSLDIASLRFIAHSLPYDDEFTKDLWTILDEVLDVLRPDGSSAT